MEINGHSIRLLRFLEDDNNAFLRRSVSASCSPLTISGLVLLVPRCTTEIRLSVMVMYYYCILIFCSREEEELVLSLQNSVEGVAVELNSDL